MAEEKLPSREETFARSSVKPSLRAIVADSRIAIIAIALLALLSFGEVFNALVGPFYSAGEFLATAVAIGKIPYSDWALTVGDRLSLIESAKHLFAAGLNCGFAMILSRWAYGAGLLQSLRLQFARMVRANHV